MGDKSKLVMEFEYSERVSRLFIFRFLWTFVFIWPFYLLALFVGFASLFHFVYMFVLGRRQETMWVWSVRFAKWLARWNSYLQASVDERPKLWW